MLPTVPPKPAGRGGAKRKRRKNGDGQNQKGTPKYGTAMKQTEETTLETIVGIVAASQVDEDDHVIAVTISTDDEDYEVDMSGLGEDLLDFIDEEVEVTGIVAEESDGTKSITATSYEVLEYDSDEDSDEDYGDGLDFEDLAFDDLGDQYAY